MTATLPIHARERDPLGFFAELEAATRAAERACGEVVERDLAIGRSRVRIRLAGPAFVDSVLPALAHLAVRPEAAPDATISIWDSASTGVGAPAFPWVDLAARGTPVGFAHPRLRTIVDPGFGGVTMFDAVRRTGVVWAPSAVGLPWWERAAPLRAALYWATVGPGQHLIHAGAVGDSRGGVLLAGRGGSGKSTLSLACVERGLDYAGDDYVLLTADPAPAAHSVYRSAKLHPSSLDLLPGLAAAVESPPAQEGDKVVLDIAGHRPERMAASLPVTAIVQPRVTGAVRPVLRRVSARDALMALAPSTVYQLPGDSGAALATLAAVARRAPAYVLGVGSDVAAAADIVAGIVRGEP